MCKNPDQWSGFFFFRGEGIVAKKRVLKALKIREIYRIINHARKIGFPENFA